MSLGNLMWHVWIWQQPMFILSSQSFQKRKSIQCDWTKYCQKYFCPTLCCWTGKYCQRQWLETQKFSKYNFFLLLKQSCKLMMITFYRLANPNNLFWIWLSWNGLPFIIKIWCKWPLPVCHLWQMYHRLKFRKVVIYPELEINPNIYLRQHIEYVSENNFGC